MKNQSIPTDKERRKITYRLRLFFAKSIMYLVRPFYKWSESIISRDEMIKCESDRVGIGRGLIVRFDDKVYKNLDHMDNEQVIMEEFWPFFKPQAQQMMNQ